MPQCLDAKWEKEGMIAGLYSVGKEKTIVEIEDCKLQDQTANEILNWVKPHIPVLQDKVNNRKPNLGSHNFRPSGSVSCILGPHFSKLPDYAKWGRSCHNQTVNV